MNSRLIGVALLCTIAILLVLIVLALTVHAQVPISILSKRSPRSPDNSSIAFIPNRGQLADQFRKPMPEVIYSLDARGVKFYVTKNGFHYVFGKYPSHGPMPQPKDPHVMDSLMHADSVLLYRVDVAFVGANPNPRIETSNASSTYYNYYLPQCPDGITRVPAYQTLIFRDLYPHIDLVLYAGGRNADRSQPANHDHLIIPGSDHGMEYDFIVHPGGDPRQIQLRYDHADSLVLGQNGWLRFVTPYGEMIEERPYSLQSTGGSRIHAIVSHFALHGNTLRFTVGRYDHSRDLTIDPPRLWGSYFGGPSYDLAEAIGVDRRNNVNIVGYTESTMGIATSGAYQVHATNGYQSGYVASFSPSGTMRWATYYSGNYWDLLNALACDTACGIVAAGYTESTSGIATPGAYRSAMPNSSVSLFLVTFDSNGMRRWGTYFGGNIFEYGAGVAVDSANNILLTGFTYSTSGIATPGAYQTTNAGAYDGFFAKFTPAGTILWSTFLGGSSTDWWTNVSCDKENNIYFGMYTASYGLATAGAFDTANNGMLYGKFSPNGRLDWSTYFPIWSWPIAIAASRSGNLYIGGPVIDSTLATPGAYQTKPHGIIDGAIVRFDSAGHRLWCTYYGGADTTEILGIAADTNENVVVCGYTTSDTGIASRGEYQTTHLHGAQTPFLAKFDSTGQLHWGTYYGDSGRAVAIAIDRNNHAAIVGGTSTLSGVYATPGVWEATPAGGEDIFVARFCDTLEIPVTASPSANVCPGTAVTLRASAGLSSYQWNLNGTPIPGATSSTYTTPLSLTSGTYLYTVHGTPADANVCEAASWPVRIVIGGAKIKIGVVPALCLGTSVQLLDTIIVSGPVSYSWSPAIGLDHPDSAQPMASPTMTTTYTLSVTDSNGCVTTGKVTAIVNPLATVSAGGNQTVCQGSMLKLHATTSGGMGPFRYSWAGTDLKRNDSSTVLAAPASSTKYFVTVTDISGCIAQDSVLITVIAPPILSLGPAVSICPGSSIQIGAKLSGDAPKSIQWSPASGLSDPTILQPVASPSASTLYTARVTSKAGCIVIDSILVTVSDSLLPAIAASGPLTICTGDTTKLTVASGYASYAWSSGDNTPSISVTKSGDYFVHVTSSSGCEGTSKAVHVTVLPDSIPRPVLTAPATMICEGDSIELGVNGSFSNYHWSTGAITPSIYVSQAGSYYVTTANSQGCEGTSQPLTFSVIPKPNVSLTSAGPTTFCEGDSVVLSATPGFSYVWTKDGQPMSDTTRSLVVKSSCVASVTATNSAGCSVATQPVAITVNPVPKPVLSGPSSICVGSISNYRILQGSGAASDGVQWQLSPSSLGTVIAGQGTDSIAVHWNGPATGTLTVFSTSRDGCLGLTQIPVTIDSQLSPTVLANGPLEICEGDSVTLDAGSGYLSYQWSENGIPLLEDSLETLTTAQSGTYRVTVSAASGCSGNSKAMSVTVYPSPPKPMISVMGQQLTASAASRYSWMRDGAVIPQDTAQTIMADSAGSYVVSIIDTHGCSSSSDPLAYEPNSAQPHVELSLGSIQAFPGDHVSLPLRVVTSQGLPASIDFSYTIRFNKSLLGLADLSAPSTVSGRDRSVTRHGTLTNQLSSTPVDKIEFIAALGDTSETPIYIDTIVWSGGKSISTTIDTGRFMLLGICPAGGNRYFSESGHVLLHSIVPNPVHDAGSLDYSLAEPGETSVRVLDMLGRTAAVVVSGNAEPGSYHASVNATELPTGVYTIVLRTPSQIFSTRMEVYH
ncbi:MAG: T9SS type A sorting domain-containing protein [Bacteroidota bacterium]|nr:T9SS type A sorting domain-containing protein [Bacteroidota bacterium]MDP4232980.1 T9SS type A sorting domain-containing protein [Bacteroidota bacterium]MDP4242024.1 T9SS type A sorting domain-containing protein [Bacteroidota bacterium]MDP4286927.1 T9SS type A sorting domain-containing protein [Bacteroidota bacterium]